MESPGILSKVLERSWTFDAKSHGKSEKKSWNLIQLFWWEPWLGRKGFYGETSIWFLYVTIRAYFSHLLCAVFTHNALFVELNALFSAKNSKNTCSLGGCSIINALNLKEWVVKIHNCSLLDFFAVLSYTACMSLFSRISPDYIKKIILLQLINKSLIFDLIAV